MTTSPSPSGPSEDEEVDDEDDEDEHGWRAALEMVGCCTTALRGRPTFPPAVAVSADRDEIDE